MIKSDEIVLQDTKRTEWKPFSSTIRPKGFVLNVIQHVGRIEGDWYRKK